MRRLALLVMCACQQHDDAPPTPKPPEPVYTSAGVPAGGIVRDAKEGPSAFVASIDGDVTVRRCGELAYAPATPREPLWGCDEVRTGERAAATLVLADTSTIELAEDGALAIGSRYAQADAGSTAALLFGVARFHVSTRAPGEGWLRVYTPSGTINAGGVVPAVFGVGVAIDGRVRLVTEAGTARSARDSDESIEETDAPIDWGAWRVGADARADVEAAFLADGRMLLHLEDALAEAYAGLPRIAEQCARYERKMSVALANPPPDRVFVTRDGAWLGAAYATARRIEQWTWQFAGHAALANEIYSRHPELAAKVPALVARLDAAIVWPKRFEATAYAFLRPLRLLDYALGQDASKAEAVGIAVPAGAQPYGGFDVSEIEQRTEVPFTYLDEPDVELVQRAVWVLDPPPEWISGVAVPAARPWYTRHDQLAAPVIVGVPPKAHALSRMVVQPAQTREQLGASWQIPLNEVIHVHPPDLALQQRTRANMKLDHHRVPH